MNNTMRATIGALSCSVLALSLAACGDDSDDEDVDDQEEVTEEEDVDDTDDLGGDLDDDNEDDDDDLDDDLDDGDDSEDDLDADDDADAGASGTEEVEVEIGEVFEDPDVGDTVEVVSAVRHFDSEEQSDLIADGGEVVLVEVEITPGDEFGGRISVANFRISADDGADFSNNDTRMIEDEMADADRPALEDISRIDGGDHHGWVAFFVDEEADTYVLEYERPAAEIIGEDDELDEFVEEIEIPSS